MPDQFGSFFRQLWDELREIPDWRALLIAAGVTIAAVVKGLAGGRRRHSPGINAASILDLERQQVASDARHEVELDDLQEQIAELRGLIASLTADNAHVWRAFEAVDPEAVKRARASGGRRSVELEERLSRLRKWENQQNRRGGLKAADPS